MTGPNRDANSRDEIERGNECLAAAEHLQAGGFANDAVSRAYYAAYHWARALLLTKGLEPKSHRGLIQLISLHFVKGGLLPEDAAGDLGHLETYREVSDYHTRSEFTSEQAEQEIERARRFIEACRPLVFNR